MLVSLRVALKGLCRTIQQREGSSMVLCMMKTSILKVYLLVNRSVKRVTDRTIPVHYNFYVEPFNKIFTEKVPP